jgi:hypothetical protein
VVIEMMQSHGYLSRLLPPVAWDQEEIKIREDVEQGRADDDERQIVISELEAANWPPELADKMTRKPHPIEHGTR